VSTLLSPRTGRIRWADLSVQSTAILRQVVAPIHLDGFTVTETAKRLGIPLASVRLLVEYLAREVSELARSQPTTSGRSRPVATPSVNCARCAAAATRDAVLEARRETRASSTLRR
jgi:hypothetical protein